MHIMVVNHIILPMVNSSMTVVEDLSIIRYRNSSDISILTGPGDFQIVSSIKNFSLNIQFDGRVGGVIVNYIQRQTFRGGRHIETIEGAYGIAREQDYKGVKSFVGPGKYN